MLDIQYREVTQSDIPGLAKIRAAEWETEEYWKWRIAAYLNKELHPQKALLPRVIYVAVNADKITGFIAGHLTQRFNCDGELEWINVIPEYRKKGIALAMLRLLAKWFIDQKALTVCVDPGNAIARKFYIKNSAENLNEHWLVWKDISSLLK